MPMVTEEVVSGGFKGTDDRFRREGAKTPGLNIYRLQFEEERQSAITSIKTDRKPQEDILRLVRPVEIQHACNLFNTEIG